MDIRIFGYNDSICDDNRNTRNSRTQRVARRNDGQNRRNGTNDGDNRRRRSRTQGLNGNISDISRDNLDKTWCFSFWKNDRNVSEEVDAKLFYEEIKFSELAANGYEVRYHYMKDKLVNGIEKTHTLPMKKGTADYAAAEEVVAGIY